MKSKILFTVIGICLGILLTLSPLKNINYSDLLSSALDGCSTEQDALTSTQEALNQNQTDLASLPSSETLNAQLTELQGQLTSTQDTITALQKENTTLIPSLTVKESSGKTVVYQSPEHFEQALQTKKTTVSSLQKQTDNLRREIARLSAIKPQTATIQKQIQTYNNRITINNTTIANLKKDMQTMEELLPKIQKIKANLTQITTLQATHARVQSDITAVQKQISDRNALETAQPGLQQAVDDAQKALDECQNGGVCGNGIQEGQEECDLGEGNTDRSGSCTLECELHCNSIVHYVNGSLPDNYQQLKTYHPKSLADTEFVFITPPTGVDPYNYALTLPNSCIMAKTDNDCGNGKIESPEECDDGNTVDGDGCDSFCHYENYTICGNNVLEAGEECDDGNSFNGDGCSATCMKEEEAVCGNGKIEAGEECETDEDAGEGYVCIGCKRAEVRQP